MKKDDHSKTNLVQESRFVPIEQRSDVCDIAVPLWREMSANYENVRWRGVFIEKGPFQLAAIPLLLQNEAIQSVIELGAQSGGSAMWLADQLALLNRGGTVLSMDIDLSLLDPRAVDHPGVRFIQGDCRNIERDLTKDILDELPHPWLVLEDAHVNLSGILDHLHGCGMRTGDYLIVEDTNLDMCKAWMDWSDPDYIANMANKLAVLRTWLARVPGQYTVDTLYQDLFGYNVSKSWNSILRCC